MSEREEKLLELIEDAIDLDIISEEEDGSYVFDDEPLGSSVKEILKYLDSHREVLSKIIDLVNEANEEDDEEEDEFFEDEYDECND